MMFLPESYNTISLPAVKLSHHPFSSLTPTPIVIVALNRPEAKNAFNNDMIESLEQAFNLLSTDPRVKCIILTGSDPTNRIFCAGMDLSFSTSTSATTLRDSNSQDNNNNNNNNNNTTNSPSSTSTSTSKPPGRRDQGAVTRDTHRDGGGRVALAIYRCAKPTIAAINGSAVGVGITMTLPCHIRVTSRHAKVGFVFARRGLVMEACSSFFLPRLVGAGRALHLVTTGAVYDAADPLFSGLFTETVDSGEEVLTRALGIAEEVSVNCSAVSVGVMRDMIYRGPGSAEEAHLLESRLLFDMFRGRDFLEGIQSFLQKKQPEFKGSMGEDALIVYPWWEDRLKKRVSRL